MRRLSEISKISHLLLINVVDTVGVRILVIEDNATLADAVERGLGADGYAVDVAHDGLDGLWRAREFAYDLIVLDIMVPGMNGFEVCRTLRNEAVATPILMLTAKDGEYDIAEGLDLGADDYLTKPFSFVVLLARVRALTRRQSPSRTSEVEVGVLTIDTSGHRCTVDGRPLDLTAREYALLETLALSAGYPLTRSHLLDRVWGPDNTCESNIVDVYIGYLRKKLGDAADQPQIDTVRGVGYRLVAK